MFSINPHTLLPRKAARDAKVALITYPAARKIKVTANLYHLQTYFLQYSVIHEEILLSFKGK